METLPPQRRVKRHKTPWLLRFSEPGEENQLLWLIVSNGDFLLKCLLFLLGFGILIWFEMVVVKRVNHSLNAKKLQMASNPSSAAPLPAMASQPGTAAEMMRQARWLKQNNQFDMALTQVNSALQETPEDPEAYELRGTIYVGLKRWESAREDYAKVVDLVGARGQVKFDLADLDFEQKNYDGAHGKFVALEQDLYFGDLATYRAFLCDLFAGHEEAAHEELQELNQTADGASYYFANAAWAIYHHNSKEAQSWLNSAAAIYAPDKCDSYTASLTASGYLPLPPEF